MTSVHKSLFTSSGWMFICVSKIHACDILHTINMYLLGDHRTQIQIFKHITPLSTNQQHGVCLHLLVVTAD